MNLIWTADNNQNKFVPIDSNKLEWVEKINNQTMFFFTFVKYYEKENGLLLYDEERDLNVFIHNNQLKVGYSLDNLRPLYTGRWINFDEKKSMIDHFRQAELEMQKKLLLSYNEHSSIKTNQMNKKINGLKNDQLNETISELDLDEFMVDVLEKARFDPDEEYLTIFSESPLLSDNDADFESDSDDYFIGNGFQNNNGKINLIFFFS